MGGFYLYNLETSSYRKFRKMFEIIALFSLFGIYLFVCIRNLKHARNCMCGSWHTGNLSLDLVPSSNDFYFFPSTAEIANGQISMDNGKTFIEIRVTGVVSLTNPNVVYNAHVWTPTPIIPDVCEIALDVRAIAFDRIGDKSMEWIGDSRELIWIRNE